MPDTCSFIEDLPYDFEVNKVISEIKRIGARRVLLQAPPGLKKYLGSVAECLERLGNVEVFINIDDVYGGCDLLYNDVINFANIDLVIHYGHTPYPKDPTTSPGGGLRPNHLFIPAFSRLGLDEKVIEEVLIKIRELNLKNVGLVASLQHVNRLRELLSALSRRGVNVLIPKGAPPYFLDGQVIGCDYRVALSIKNKVDGYVLVSGGRFHAIGLYLSTRLPLILLDPYEGKAVDFTGEGERILRVRLYKVMKSLDLERWGIIVGTKTGQYRPGIVARLVSELKDKGLKYKILVSNVLNKEILGDVDADWFQGFVVTSCPRIAIDDLGDYHKPVLTPGEMRMVLSKNLEKYFFPW
jgi:2-(3-amino-3-carboxypropyl)histidine synthase